MEYFLTLASGVPAFMRYFFPVTIVAAGLWVWALVATGRSLKDRPLCLVAWCLLPVALTVSILTIGVVFSDGRPLPGAQAAAFMIYALVFAHLPLGVVLAKRSGPQWPVVAASSGACGWSSCCAAIVSIQSVTGVWL